MLTHLMAIMTLAAPPANEAPINVVATLTDFGAIAAAVGGDRVQVTTIASGVQNPHFVDPKPSYVLKLRDAELLFVNGLDLEIGWVPALLEGARNGRVRVGAPGYVDCSTNIPVIEVPSGQVTRAEGDVHPFGNPHYTTDPLNLKLVAETVAQAFQAARPASADYFQARKTAFQRSVDEHVFGKELVDLVGGKKLDRLTRSGELDAFLASETSEGKPLATRLGGWLAAMKPVRGRKLVFFHKSYSYFHARFGLDVTHFIELRPGIQPGPAHLADLVGVMRRESIRVVGTHPFHDESIAKLVAEKAGGVLVTVPLNLGGVKGTDDFVGFFDTVTRTLERALEK